jgi:hypothetical protein
VVANTKGRGGGGGPNFIGKAFFVL